MPERLFGNFNKPVLVKWSLGAAVLPGGSPSWGMSEKKKLAAVSEQKRPQPIDSTWFGK
jgi:hypothetical protein